MNGGEEEAGEKEDVSVLAIETQIERSASHVRAMQRGLYSCIEDRHIGMSEQKSNLLNEFKRRNVLVQLRRALHPLVGDWWWARDEVLDAIMTSFEQSGTHAVVDGFVGEEAPALREEVLRARTSDCISTPGMLGGGENGIASQSFEDTMVRSDNLGWFDCSTNPDGGVSACSFDGNKLSSDWPLLSVLLQKIETLVAELGARNTPNEFSGCSTRSRAMVTLYSGRGGGGSRYTKHYDNANGNGRRVTAIYYTNAGWTRAHGGQLRMYTPAAVGEKPALFVDVEPVADRLLLFYSDTRCLHEVLPACADRYAVTVWFFDKAEKALAKARSEERSSAP